MLQHPAERAHRSEGVKEASAIIAHLGTPSALVHLGHTAPPSTWRVRNYCVGPCVASGIPRLIPAINPRDLGVGPFRVHIQRRNHFLAEAAISRARSSSLSLAAR